jgi:hypothetical protein
MDKMPMFSSRKIVMSEAARKTRRRRSWCGLAGSALILIFLFDAAVPRAQQSPLIMTVRPWQPQMSIGGPIAIELTMQNQSRTTLTVDLGEDEKEGIHIRMSSPQGQSYSSSWKPKEGASLIGKVPIGTGSTVERILVLKDWNISPIPGDYKVVISFRHMARIGTGEGHMALTATGEELPVEPVTVQLRVVERDPSLIQSECELAKSLFLNAHNYDEAWAPANLLAKFGDASALECLSETHYAGSPHHIERALLHAIGNIGTDAARRILIDIANGNRKDDAEVAKGELDRMGQR